MNRWKLKRKLKKTGSFVEEGFMVYINNDEPKSLYSSSEVYSYIRDYRSSNSIFKLQIYRIEVYSL